MVFIEKLIVNCHVGAEDVERAAKQPVCVDVACELKNPVVEQDDVVFTLNYATLVKSISKLAARRRWRLLETFAAEIAAICFEDSLVRRAIVTLRKPFKLIGVDAVGVTRTFKQGGAK